MGLTESKTSSLQDLVDQVVDKEFDLDALKLDYNTIEVTKDVVDETRPLKNVATDLVVNEFFKTEDTLYRFLTYVYTTFEKALDIYRRERSANGQPIRPDQLFFLYKGGNILRIVSREFLLELPSSATKEIAEFYSQFFKRSDADFSIYIDPQLDDYDEIYHEITLLAYLVQDQMRTHFQQNLTDYFNIFQYNSDYQSQVLQPYLDEFNKVGNDEFVNFRIGDAIAVQKPPPFRYRANPDTTIRFINEDEDWMLPVREAAIGVIKMPQPGQLMTITHNNSLDFPGGTADIRQRFNLTRTKFIFTLLKNTGETQNVGGELIDVSIPHRADSKIQHFFDHMDRDVVRYTLRSGETELPFNAYSLHYLTFDLEDVLFNQKYYPWLDKKYEKRINRLMYLYFIDIFIRLENATEKLELIRNVRDWVFTPMTDPNVRPRDIAKRILNFTRYESLGLNIQTLMEELLKLMVKVEQNPDQTDEMRELGQVLVKNTNFLLDTLQKVRQYCSVRDGKVEKRDLYDAPVSSLI